MACILRVADGHVQGCFVFVGLPTAIEHLDDGAQGAVGDDALCARANGGNHRRLLTVPTAKGTKSEGVAHPKHIVAIAFGLLFLGGIELGGLKFQPFLVLTVEVDGLSLVKIDADAVEFALEIHAMMMLDVIRVGTVATGRDGLNEVVVLVFFLHLIVADEHLRIDSGRVGAGLAF